MTEKTLTEQIQTTTDNLTELETEQSDFQNRMTVAVNDADSSAIIALKHRADDLPIEIQAARIRLERLRIQAEESKFPAMHAEIERLYPAVVETRQVKDEAGRAFSVACAAHQSALDDLRQRKIDISERKRGVEALLNSKPSAPIRQSLLMNGAR
jgi:hypothetical protein